jgi:hypothetical protein
MIDPPRDADSSGAIAAARAEARQWSEIASHWAGYSDGSSWNDVVPREADVVRFFDPVEDLTERARSWNHELSAFDLADLARFAAGLAVAEADAWRDDQPHIATRAFSDRRFLVGDRLVHWVVPWLDTVARCHPPLREVADEDRDVVLAIADFHRPAPDLAAGREGLYPPGHDSFGPIEPQGSPADHVSSIWSGTVVMRATMVSMTGAPRSAPGVTPDDLENPETKEYLALLYTVRAARWRNLAEAHPGAAALWLDLAQRAAATSQMLRR